MTNPASIVDGNNTFTAPDDAELTSTWTYFVVVKVASGDVSVGFTNSEDEDSDSADGWIIANDSRHRNRGSTDAWSTDPASMKIDIRGAAITAPTLSAYTMHSIPFSGTTYKRGETIKIRATFSEPVDVTGTPQLELPVGTAAKQMNYVSGSGTRDLVFALKVRMRDADDQGIAIGSGSQITLNGGSIQSVATGISATFSLSSITGLDHTVDGSQLPLLLGGTKLVHNTGATISDVPEATHALGLPGTSNVTAFAQRFTTGATDYRFSLSAIGIPLQFQSAATDPSKISVSIWSANDDRGPGKLKYVLTKYREYSGEEAATDVEYFSAQEGAELMPETDYYVIVSMASDATLGFRYAVSATKEETTNSDGWKIAGTSRTRDTAPLPPWPGTERAHTFIEVWGEAIDPPPGPLVTSIEVSSTPEVNNTYYFDETIQFTVTYDQDVTVVGVPTFKFTLKTGVGTSTSSYEKSAVFKYNSAGNALVFDYTVAEADEDNNGLYIDINAVVVGSGQTITSVHSGVAAQLDAITPPGTQDGHKVNGSVGRAQVSFDAAIYPVPEGDSVSITVQFDAAIPAAHTIPLIFSPQDGASSDDYDAPVSVTIPAYSTSTTFTISAQSDALDDDYEWVIITFGTLPDLITPDPDEKQTAIVELVDDPADVGPQSVSIAAVYPAVVPCLSSIEYTLTREGTTTDPLDVRVELVSQHDYLKNNKVVQTVSFAANKLTNTLSIPPNDCGSADQDGTLIARVIDGAGYEPGGMASADVDMVGTGGQVIIIIRVENLDRTVTENDAPIDIYITGQADAGLPLPRRTLKVSLHRIRYRSL